ncbi:hypothetical protein ZIOFF_033092 [Zingiber officinale]|uniref:Uncharacterized protein n=1 Tax=Zingiber officinale TaxID=94328 RepID=A0A8J5LC10_ZINOF|nr:hypothetical protein ZIOFF_033092 [Zingiber officinale]
MAGVAEQAIAAEDQFARCEKAAAVECQDEVEAKLSHLLSKLNPSAKEFFPSNYASVGCQKPDDRLSPGAPVFVAASAFHGYGPASSGGSRGMAMISADGGRMIDLEELRGKIALVELFMYQTLIINTDYEAFNVSKFLSAIHSWFQDPELLSTLNCTFNIEDD